MKSRICIAFLCIYMFSMCGCIQTSELKEKSIVQAVGIDRNDEKYDVILQNFRPEGSGKIAFDPSKQNNLVVEEEGITIGQALKFIRIHHGKEIFFGNNNVIVVGRSTAEEGIREIFNYFNGNHECRPNMNIVMADGTAADILKAQVKDGPTPALVLEQALQEYNFVGIIDAVEMVNVVGRMQKEGSEAHMPIVKITMDAQNNPEYDIESTAIFKGDKLIGELNRGQTRGMRFFNNQIVKTHLVMEDGEHNKYTITVHKSKTKVKVNIKDDIPYINVEVKLKAKIDEAILVDKDGLSVEDTDKIKKICEEKIESEVFSALSYTLREKKADAIGVARYIFQQKPSYWKANSKRWDEIMPSVVFEINANCELDRISLDIRK